MKPDFSPIPMAKVNKIFKIQTLLIKKMQKKSQNALF